MADKKKPAQKPSSDALESFLSREQKQKSKKTQPAKKGKLNKKLLIPLLAVAAVAVLVIVLLLVRRTPTVDESALTPEANIISSVSESGEHEVMIPTDDKGNIAQNGVGSLLSYVPAEISRIDVENASGTFSVLSEVPEGGSATYTIEGFEDETLQSGAADEIANDASTVPFKEIIAVHGNPADFGLDHPRATVKIHLRDNSTATVRVGNEAAANAGAYISFGSGDGVFLAADDAVDSFLYSLTDLISKTINEAAEEAGSGFSTLTISGSHFPEPITLVPNTDEAVDAAYRMTAPMETPADAVEAADIAGNIRDLYAEEVVCVNPSEQQLADYGLSKPYASIKAEYDDCTVALDASAPGEDGLVYLYSPDKNIIYTIQLAAVCWAKTSVEALMPEMIVSVKLPAVSEISVSSGSRSYTFSVATSTETQTDDDGNEQELTTVNATYNGKALTEDNFRVFFQNLNGIKNQGATDSKSGSTAVKLSLRYSTDRSDDVIEACTLSDDSAHYLMKYNGKVLGAASTKYVDGLVSDAETLSKGETVGGR